MSEPKKLKKRTHPWRVWVPGLLGPSKEKIPDISPARQRALYKAKRP